MLKTLIAALLALPVAAPAGNLQTVVLDVQHMTCAVCPITVKKALEKVPGVADAKIDFDKRTATVQYDPNKASPAALVKATTGAGFPSTPRREKTP
jgi:periplasmic mercuric ion binding protein